MKAFMVFALSLTAVQAHAQDSLSFTGQASAVVTYAPRNDMEYLVALRYLPELQYEVKLDSTKLFTVLGSANLTATSFFHPFESDVTDASIAPYRIWARYSTQRYEVRLGLQKIDFGSSTLLRPLQWFNQVDPRDPLQLTNGVYGALGRYYFENNANIWLWTLYGNDQPRGMDALASVKDSPEYGGRVQYPVPRGEVALSYNNRKVDARSLLSDADPDGVPENRIGLDGKWDVTVGLWFEATQVHRSADLGLQTDQTLLNLGTDYTFGVGNGLNVVAEHLIAANDSTALAFAEVQNTSAMSASYPLNLNDNLSAYTYYSWATRDVSIVATYEHQFRRITGYLMGFYNPSTQQGVQENDLVYYAAGPGFRLMLVYNH